MLISRQGRPSPGPPTHKRYCALTLRLESFQTGAVTFSGIGLVHRIRKRRFAVAYDGEGRVLSLKELWQLTLSGISLSVIPEKTPSSLIHQKLRSGRSARAQDEYYCVSGRLNAAHDFHDRNQGTLPKSSKNTHRLSGLRPSSSPSSRPSATGR